MSAEIYLNRCLQSARATQDKLVTEKAMSDGARKSARTNLKEFARRVSIGMSCLARGETLPAVATIMRGIRNAAIDPLPEICTSLDAAAAWRFPTAAATASPEPAPRQTTTAAPSPATSIFSRYNDPSTARTSSASSIASTASAAPAPEDPIAKFEKRVAEYPLLSRQAAREAAARKYPDECRAAQDAARRKMGIR